MTIEYVRGASPVLKLSNPGNGDVVETIDLTDARYAKAGDINQVLLDKGFTQRSIWPQHHEPEAVGGEAHPRLRGGRAQMPPAGR